MTKAVQIWFACFNEIWLVECFYESYTFQIVFFLSYSLVWRVMVRCSVSDINYFTGTMIRQWYWVFLIDGISFKIKYFNDFVEFKLWLKAISESFEIIQELSVSTTFMIHECPSTLFTSHEWLQKLINVIYFFSFSLHYEPDKAQK